MSSSAQWNERYGPERVWSGAVNPTLKAVASTLDVGIALDIGCGEGGDAIWLASTGWRVRGVDFSSKALARASEAAQAHDVGSRCEWIQADLSVWTTNRAYDLVTCHFLHEERDVRVRAWHSAAAAVAPGGTLLIVGHAPDEGSGTHGPPRESRFDEDEITSALALSSGWEVEVDTVARQGNDGSSSDRLDVVFSATRIGR
jgi:SAM-dependent methyltransferase